MKKIVRFNAMDPISIFDEFDRMMRRPLVPTMNRTWNVAVDVSENEDAYMVKATLPGIDIDELDITLEDNVLTLKGEFKSDEEREGERYHVRERQFGSFSRAIRFPVAVNGESVDAMYKDGILHLNVPKAEEVKPKKIAVKTS